MVLVEDRPRLGDVDRLLVGQRPRKLDQPVEPGPHHPRLAGRLRHPLVAAQLLARLRLDLLGHAGLGDRLGELGHFLGLAVALAELALDRRHLLAQHRLALALVESGLGLPADLVADPQHLDALGEEPRHPVHARAEVDRLEDLLLLLRLDVEVGGRDVGERGGRGDRPHRLEQALRRLRQEPDRLDGQRLEVEEAALDLGEPALRLRDTEDPGDRERRPLEQVEDAEALHALADDVMAAVGRRHVAQDVGDGADAMEAVRAGVVRRRVALQDDPDRAFLADRLLHRGDRRRAADRDRDDHSREEHQVADRQQDQRILGERHCRLLALHRRPLRPALRPFVLQQVHGVPPRSSFSRVKTRPP